LFRSYSPKLGTIYSEDYGEKYHRLCDEGRQRWRAEKKRLAAGLLHD